VAASRRPADRRPQQLRAGEATDGEVAFYGPKIDVQIADSAGREATLSTVQIDFHQPE
jgi:threonyl-tRNA synthetase